MWQDVANITREDGDGRYEFDKEEKMPYLLRLEMERTRRKIRDYLCNVFAGYEFEIVKGKSVMRGPGHLTALEWIEQDYRNCYHYNQELGRRGGDEYAFNSKSADGGKVTHGAKVYTTDYNGRIIVGTAYYNINNMWWVVSGKYGLRNKASFEIYTSHPGDLKRKRNDRTRLNRLESEMKKAVAVMDFKRADALKPLLLDARQKGETTA